MNPARLRAYIELLIVAVIWGIASPVIKYTLTGFDSITFLAYRFGLSTIVALISFLILKTKLPKDKNTFWQLIGYGFITSSVALGFLFFGLENTTVLDMSLISLTSPILVTVAGVIFLSEHVTKKEKIGMTIALIGTVLTVVEPIINGASAIRLSGNILIIGYLIATAWGAVLTKELLRKNISPILMTNVSFVIGFLTFFPLFLIYNDRAQIEHFLFRVPILYHVGVWYMAILSGSLAYYLGNKAQKTIEIGEASLFSYLSPIFSTVIAVLWLKESITPTFIAGSAIVVLGVILAEWKKAKN